MDFKEAIGIVDDSLKEQDIKIYAENYDGLIVKVLKASNTLDLGRTTNQTHIAITGEQMDIFPSIYTELYHNSTSPEGSMKKYFVGIIDVFLSRNNINYLNSDSHSHNDKSEDIFIKTHTAVIRNVRKRQADQIQLSILDVDGEHFIDFRRNLHENDVLIILKRSEKLEYESYGVKEDSFFIEKLNELNNKFYYKKSSTIVNMTESRKVLGSNLYRVEGGQNILLYGVPGSGKSHTISEEYCSDESKIERIVFHPDYMNTDFIGQILPTIKGDEMITYEFTPGPFTRIMKKAYEDPENEYYLIIEEINRGNAPAIFGEVFQLLDRDEFGNSSYSIRNYNLAEIVYKNPEHPVSIPSNLTILATMNTADQNVFTLDTAFQRRWIMRLIKNDVLSAEHANIEILDTGVNWGVFNTTINEFILASSTSTMSSEDKRLGAYFITKNILESKDKSIFAEKVIKYLWDDAFKFARNKYFDSSYRSLEKVIEDFSSFSGLERFNIFSSEIKKKLGENIDMNDGTNEEKFIEDKSME